MRVGWRVRWKMIRLMFSVKLTDKKTNVELRESMRVENVRSVIRRRRLRWYGHVMRKSEDNWVKKCLEIDVVGVKPRGRPKKSWMEVVAGDMSRLGLKDDDAQSRVTWRSVINRDRSIFQKPANPG